MRILVLLTDAFGGFGGIAKFNRDFLTALCSFPECKEIVVLPRVASEPIGDLPPKLNYIKEGLNNKFKYLLTLFKTIKRQSDFDLIICGHIHLLFLAYLSKRMLKRPLALIIHGIDAWKLTRDPFVNWAASRIDHLISVSRFSEDKFIQWAKLKNTPKFILPNSIDLNQFTPGEKNKNLLSRYGLEGKKVIMTLARLDSRDRYKGIDEVLEVMPDLIKKIPNLTYLIVGDGTDRSRLEAKSKMLHLNGHVVFPGRIKESEKVDHYRIADVFVMPGWGEGFGIAYLEAIACNVPVIGSKLDASSEVLKNGLGITVNPHSKTEIKEAVKKSLFDPNRRLNLKEYDAEHFNSKVKEILDFINKAALKKINEASSY